MQLSDFDFDLPEGLIAVRPAVPRESAQLLVARGGSMGAGIEDLHVADLIDQFHAGDRLVLNNTKVIPARLSGARHRATTDAGSGAGVAKVEVTLLEPHLLGDQLAPGGEGEVGDIREAGHECPLVLLDCSVFGQRKNCRVAAGIDLAVPLDIPDVEEVEIPRVRLGPVVVTLIGGGD